jgi:ribosome-associated protein
MASDTNDLGDPVHERPSKSARKREAKSLQDLGVQLAELPDAELEALDLPDNLKTALQELTRLRSHGAQVRQRQYIGKLMRKIDPEPVLEKLEARKRTRDAELRGFQRIERWRDRLLAHPEAAAELLEEYPRADREALDELLEKALRERADERPPAAARALFAFLRQLMA